MAKKGDTKPKKERKFDDSIPLKDSHKERTGLKTDFNPFDVILEESIDMGISRPVRAFRGDKPESPRKAKVEIDPIPTCTPGRSDMGISPSKRACKGDKPESPRKAKKKT